MNIEKDYESNDNISSATEAMDASMGFIFEKFIEPSEADLSENDLMMVAVIGSTLKIIAEKAQLYENMMEGKQSNIQRN